MPELKPLNFNKILISFGALPSSYLCSLSYEEQLLLIGKHIDEIDSFINNQMNNLINENVQNYINQTFNNKMFSTLYNEETETLSLFLN